MSVERPHFIRRGLSFDAPRPYLEKAGLIKLEPHILTALDEAGERWHKGIDGTLFHSTLNGEDGFTIGDESLLGLVQKACEAYFKDLKDKKKVEGYWHINFEVSGKQLNVKYVSFSLSFEEFIKELDALPKLDEDPFREFTKERNKMPKAEEKES